MQGTHFLTQAVDCQPRRTATLSGARRRTWQEVGERVPRLAAALRAFGIADGAFVAALGFNSDRYVELFFAVPWAGGAFAPLNIRWSVAEDAYALTDSKSSVLFVDESFIDQARELERQLPWVKTLVYMGEGEVPAGMLGYEDLIERHAPMADANRRGEDLWVIFYTGGTTAHPKGVMMSHRALFIATITYLAMLPDIEDLSFVYVAGFFHFAGANALLYVTMTGGDAHLAAEIRGLGGDASDLGAQGHQYGSGADDDQHADQPSRFRKVRPFQPADDHLWRLTHARGVDEGRNAEAADLAVLSNLRHDRDRRLRKHVALARPHRLRTEGVAPALRRAGRARKRDQDKIARRRARAAEHVGRNRRAQRYVDDRISQQSRSDGRGPAERLDAHRGRRHDR